MIVIKIDEVREGWMSDGAVIAFQIIINDHFPVGRNLIRAADAALDSVQRQAGCLNQLR